MAKNIGIQTDSETGDLAINVQRDANGMIKQGLVIGDTDYQNIEAVMLSNKGDFKAQPILGVGAMRYLKSVGRANDLRREIAVQLESIGFGKTDVMVNDDGALEIDI